MNQMAHLLEERHLGVLLSAMSLLLALAAKAPGDYGACKRTDRLTNQLPKKTST